MWAARRMTSRRHALQDRPEYGKRHQCTQRSMAWGRRPQTWLLAKGWQRWEVLRHPNAGRRMYDDMQGPGGNGCLIRETMRSSSV